MFSYHPRPVDFNASRYSTGWKVTQVNTMLMLAHVIKNYVWSPIIYEGGQRAERNFVECHWCALDFDDPGITIEEAKNIWCDTEHIIGTTKSHRKNKNGVICDRFRVLVKFEEVCRDLATYRHTMKKLIMEYDADRACIDGARIFWPCVEVVAYGAGEYRQELYKPPPAKSLHDASTQRLAQNNTISGYTEALMMYGAKPGMRNRKCFSAALELARKGYTPKQIYAMIYAKIPTTTDFDEREKVKIIDSAFRNAKIKPAGD